jgi:hypothetical protein
MVLSKNSNSVNNKNERTIIDNDRWMYKITRKSEIQDDISELNSACSEFSFHSTRAEYS